MNYLYLDIKYLMTKKIWITLFGLMRRNLIKVFYVKWSNNFGDLLTPIILKHYQLTPVFAYPKKAQAVVVGTILEIVKPSFSGYILGSGWTRERLTSFPSAKIRGLRGYYSKRDLQLYDEIVIGDPGLLVSDILPYERKNKYLLGIIPHESEIADERLILLKRRLKDQILIVNPRRADCKKVLREIVSCSYIVSSSLHGLIVSDSYGIPNARIKLNDIDDSEDYKFRDYYSSIDEDLKTLKVDGAETIETLLSVCRMPPKEKIATLKDQLNKMFSEFSKEIRK